MAKRRGRSEGAIYRRKSDGRWAASLSCGWENGRRKRVHFLASTQREVINKLAEARADLRAGRPIGSQVDAPKKPAASQTTAEFLEWWLENVVQTGETKPRTREGYTIIIRRHVLPQLGVIPIADVTSRQILDLLAGCKGNRAARAIDSSEYPKSFETRIRLGRGGRVDGAQSGRQARPAAAADAA
jgi:integrase